jgi:hypothetical protein
MDTPYQASYANPSVGRILSYGPSVSEVQAEEEGRQARKLEEQEPSLKHKETMFRQQIASKYAEQYGVPFKDAMELANNERDAYQVNQKAELEERIKQAGYSKALGEYRSKLSSIDMSNLSEAGDKLQELSTKYSYLSGAINPEIAKGYEEITGLHSKTLQSSIDKLQKVLPKGIAVEEVLNEEGRPDFELGRKLASQTAEEREASKERLKQARQLAVMGKRDEARRAFYEFKTGEDIKKAQQMIPIEVQKAGALAPFKGGLIVQPTITTPTAPAPAPSPAAPMPSASPASTPAPLTEQSRKAAPEAEALAPKPLTKEALHSMADELGTNATRESLMDLAKKRGYTF